MITITKYKIETTLIKMQTYKRHACMLMYMFVQLHEVIISNPIEEGLRRVFFLLLHVRK